MRHPAIARDWFRSHVPAPLWKQLDPDSLCVMDKAFSVPHRIETLGGGRPLYCLVEHQARPDPWMALRLAEYGLAGSRQYRGHIVLNGKKVCYSPLVVPLCVYQGKVRPYLFRHRSSAANSLNAWLTRSIGWSMYRS